jgi:hypothetical protein
VDELVLPEDIDAALWFRGSCGDTDYLVRTNPHTHPGRMAAYCPHAGTDHRGYNVSISELGDCSAEVRWWAQGFVAGSEPGPPENDEGDTVAENHLTFMAWQSFRREYLRTGVWPLNVPRAGSPPLR